MSKRLLGDFIEEVSIRNKELEDLPVLSVTNTKGFIPSEEQFSKQVYSKDLSTYKIVYQDNIAYNPSRINVGSIAILEDYEKALVSPLYVIFKVNNELLPHYLLYYLRSDEGLYYIKNLATGSVRDTVKLSIIESLKCYVPSVRIQNKIVKVLNQVKYVIDKRKQQLTALEKLNISYFYETLNNDLKSLTLEELIVSTQNGISRRGDNEDGQIVLKLKNIKNNEVNFDTINRIILTEKERETYKVNENDLLVVRVNGSPKYVGRSAVYKDYKEPIYFNDHIIRVKVAGVNVQYLSYLLNSNLGISEIEKNIKTSAGQYTISRDGLNKINLNLPDERIQNEFIRKKDIINSKKVKIKISLQKLEMLYDVLIQKAFTGRLF